MSNNHNTRPDDSKDIFFRKQYIFLIQYNLEMKVISLIKSKFQVEEIMTEKGKVLIIERKDELSSENRKTD